MVTESAGGRIDSRSPWPEAASLGDASALFVRDGTQRLPIERIWRTGFAVEDAADARLRGRVEIFRGDELLSTCLIVMDTVVEGRAHYRFKSHAPARREPPRDFADNDTLAVSAGSL